MAAPQVVGSKKSFSTGRPRSREEIQPPTKAPAIAMAHRAGVCVFVRREIAGGALPRNDA